MADAPPRARDSNRDGAVKYDRKYDRMCTDTTSCWNLNGNLKAAGTPLQYIMDMATSI